jgi:hypothetical protein
MKENSNGLLAHYIKMEQPTNSLRLLIISQTHVYIALFECISYIFQEQSDRLQKSPNPVDTMTSRQNTTAAVGKNQQMDAVNYVSSSGTTTTGFKLIFDRNKLA